MGETDRADRHEIIDRAGGVSYIVKYNWARLQAIHFQPAPCKVFNL